MYKNSHGTGKCPWQTLLRGGGYVLLIGVAHDKNTYLHAVDEILKTPNRMEENYFNVKVKELDGTITNRDFKLYHCSYTNDFSQNFPKLETAFRYHHAITDGFVGNAPAQLCNARIMKEVMELLYKRSGTDPFSQGGAIPPSLYC